MKSKTIRKALQQKFDKWVESITDESLREQIKKNTIITGGAIASFLLREEVNDYDIYFRNKETTIAVANYYVQQFKPRLKNGIECPIYVDSEGDRVRIIVKSAGIASDKGADKPYEYFEGAPDERADGYVSEVMSDAGGIEDRYEETEAKALKTEDEDGKPKFRPVFMSTNAITLSHKIQIVLRFYGEPDAIHENYDFVHCTNYWSSWDGKLVLRQEALEALLTKELRYVGSKYPVCSVIRLRKFIARQWTINAGQILKMLMQISALDLTNPEVLQDQLTGVDSAYFCQLMTKLKEKDPEKVDAAYLIEIIDRIF